MNGFTCLKSVEELPPDWDELAVNYFQRRKFLQHTWLYNPCGQRYYLLHENGKLTAAAVMYTLRLDLLTYLKIKSPLKMHIVGIPCSVSSSGIFGSLAAVESLKQHIFGAEKGFVLFLNLEEKPAEGSFASGKTLPTIVLSNPFNSWGEYLSSLRSPYRRRLKIINTPTESLEFKSLSLNSFTAGMHSLYLEVYQRSKGKLEKLSEEFFRNLPPEFQMLACYRNGELIGWNIVLQDGDVFYFFLGGIDYSFNKVYNTYLRLLTSLVRRGIESGSATIDLGQTAEVPKMRMGGVPVTLYMQARHSNAFLNYLLCRFSALLSYELKAVVPNPIKEVATKEDFNSL